MGFLLKILGGSIGPYIAGAVALAFAGALAFGSVQTARLDHAKAELSQSRKALREASTALTAASIAIKVRDKAIAANAATAASEAEGMADLFRTTCKGAFNAGFLSGRGHPGPLPDGVRDDLREVQAAGAFRADRLPSEPVSPD